VAILLVLFLVVAALLIYSRSPTRTTEEVACTSTLTMETLTGVAPPYSTITNSVVGNYTTSTNVTATIGYVTSTRTTIDTASGVILAASDVTCTFVASSSQSTEP
jgi:hypothetical protein